MAILIAALLLILGNLVITRVNHLGNSVLLRRLYALLGLWPDPDTVSRFFVVGALHLVPLLILSWFLSTELRIAVTDEEHRLHSAVKRAGRLLKNTGEWWPLPLLAIASALHAVALTFLLLPGRLDPGMWWGAAVLLIGLWANYLLGPPKPLLRVPAREPATAGAEEVKAEPPAEPAVPSFYELVSAQPWFRNQIIFRLPWPVPMPIDPFSTWRDAQQRFLGKPARLAKQTSAPNALADPLVAEVAASLLGCAAEEIQLYVHQHRVLTLLGEGKHVLLATPVASGRSTVTQIAALREVLRNHRTVLVVYPDAVQGRVLSGKLTDTLVKAQLDWAAAIATYWSDEGEARWQDERMNEELAFNPDILLVDVAALQVGLLPDHRSWTHYLSQLGLIIAEDLEEYSGVFGADAALTLARLRRIAQYYGATPLVLGTQIANEGMDTFFGRFFSLSHEEFSPGQIVDEDGKASKPKELIIWNPEMSHERGPDPSAHQALRRAGYFTQAQSILSLLIRSAAQPILLQKAFPLCHADIEINEPIWRALERELGGEVHIQIGSRIEVAYERKAALRLSSPAKYDTALVVGVPGTWMNLMHELEHLGDATSQPSARIIVLLPDTPLAQYVGHTGPAIVSALDNPMQAVLPLNNPLLQERHVLAALAELPGTMAETRRWLGEEAQEALELFVARGRVRFREEPQFAGDGRTLTTVVLYETSDGPMPGSTDQPEQAIGLIPRLAGVQESSWQLLVEGNPVVTFGEDLLGWKVYPGAIVMAAGQRREIERITPEDRQALAHNVETPLATERIVSIQINPRSNFLLQETTPPDPGETLERGIVTSQLRSGSEPVRYLPEVWISVSEAVVGQQKLQATTSEPSKEGFEFPFEREPFNTRAFYLTWDDAQAVVMHTLSHLLRTVLPMFVTHVDEAMETVELDTCEIFGGAPALVVYDALPGGTGVADWLGTGNNLEQVLAKAFDVLVACPCTRGCPGCLHIPNCHTSPLDAECSLDKMQTIQTLGRVLAIDTTSTIKHRTESIELSEVVHQLAEHLYDYVFPHKLDMNIGEPAEAVVILPDEAPEELRGRCYYSMAENRVCVLPCRHDQMMTTLAHEYAHNWQRKGTAPMSSALMDAAHVPYFDGKLFIEGFAQWVEYKVAEYYEMRWDLDQIQFHHYDEYSEGFQVLRWIEQQAGSGKVMEFIRSGELVLNGESVDLERMIRESGVQARLRDAERRYKKEPPVDDVLTETVKEREPWQDDSAPKPAEGADSRDDVRESEEAAT